MGAFALGIVVHPGPSAVEAIRNDIFAISKIPGPSERAEWPGNGAFGGVHVAEKNLTSAVQKSKWACLIVVKSDQVSEFVFRLEWSLLQPAANPSVFN